MGKLKNKLIDEQDQKLIEAEKQEQKPVRDWAEIAADDEARYQASRGFTLSVPLILIGNGVGALVVRQVTIGNIENIKKYLYLKNGAKYSILFLGL